MGEVCSRLGEFPADESPYGVRDLAGGMREWVGDVAPVSSAEELDAEPEPQSGAERAESGWRMVRSGSWRTKSAWTRAASRGGLHATAIPPTDSRSACSRRALATAARLRPDMRPRLGTLGAGSVRIPRRRASVVASLVIAALALRLCGGLGQLQPYRRDELRLLCVGPDLRLDRHAEGPQRLVAWLTTLAAGHAEPRATSEALAQVLSDASLGVAAGRTRPMLGDLRVGRVVRAKRHGRHGAGRSHQKSQE
jgi:hypothetical protein